MSVISELAGIGTERGRFRPGSKPQERPPAHSFWFWERFKQVGVRASLIPNFRTCSSRIAALESHSRGRDGSMHRFSH